MSIAVIAIDGVIRGRGDMPIAAGIKLWQALASSYEMAVIADGDSARTSQWMGQNHLNFWLGGTNDAGLEAMDIGEKRLAQLTRLRANGMTNIELLIDSNPMSIEKVFSKGINCLLFVAPRYAEPNHRPDYDGTVKPWKSLVKEMDWQDEMYENDPRLAME
jgi:hypothetical protein